MSIAAVAYPASKEKLSINTDSHFSDSANSELKDSESHKEHCHFFESQSDHRSHSKKQSNQHIDCCFCGNSISLASTKPTIGLPNPTARTFLDQGPGDIFSNSLKSLLRPPIV
jgi:hypothetical protein